MINVFINVLNMSITASFAALGVTLIRIPMKKAPKVFSYALWAVVLYKLICPFTVETALSLVPVKAEPIPHSIIYTRTPSVDSGIKFVDYYINQAIANIVAPDQAPTPSPTPATTPARAPSPTPAPSPTTAPTPSPQTPYNPIAAFDTGQDLMQNILFTLSCVWLAGIIFFLLYTIASYVRLKYRLREAIPIQKNVYETDRIKTAFVLGFISPKIYMPAGLASRETGCILKHEQTHIKRRDYIIKPLALFAVFVHWFNPVIWLSYHFAMRDMELSCDESVLKHYGSDIRRDYSNTLLSLSVKQNELISPLAFGETGVKARIRNMLNYKRPAVWVSVLALAAVIAAAVLLLPNTANDAGELIDVSVSAGTGKVTPDNADKNGSSTGNSTQNKDNIGSGIGSNTGKDEENNTIDNADNNAEYNDQIADMFDTAIRYRFDYIPFFAEDNAPQTSSEYLSLAYAINSGNMITDTVTRISKQHIENIIKTHFNMESVTHEARPGAWNFDGESYTAVSEINEDMPVYVLTELTVSNKDGKIVYEAVMNHYSLADSNLASDRDGETIRTKILNGDYSSLGSYQRETFRYYLNDNGEPVFISHIMTDRPVLRWYYQMFRNDTAFKVLGSESGNFDDSQLATYAVLKIDTYSYEDGNTKEEYNAITQRYFGRNIKNFNNGSTEIIPGTDIVRATGWSYDNSMFVIAKDIWDNGDGTMTGDFYCINISDSYWTGRDGEFEEAESALFNGDISPFTDCFTSIKRIVYEVKEENGEQYFKYHSVKDMEHNITSMVLYSK